MHPDRRKGEEMIRGARPGLLVGDLLSGDGPYLAAAEAFLACRCAWCGRGVERTGVQDGDHYYCSTCWVGPARAAAGAR